MSETSESNRPVYVVERLGLTEMGPMSMARLLIDHLEASPNKPIMMIGEPGIGKTAITNQLEDSDNFHILTIRLVNEDEGTMNGYADPDKEGMTVTLRVVRKVVEAAEKAKETGKRLIIFFDEVNRAKDHMIKYVFNIIDTKRWGDYMLPSDTSFIAAINPPTKNHKVRDILGDSALRRRFALYAAKADASEYLAYAKDVKIHPSVISFIRSKPRNIYDYVALDNGQPYACPASWDAISDKVYWYEKVCGGKLANITKHANLSKMLTGTIGTAMSFDFLSHAEDMTRRYSPENILNNYGDIQQEIQDTVNSEFTAEDASLDLSKLSVISSTLACYIADRIVHADMIFHIEEDDRVEKGISKKDAIKINKQGHNLAKFIADCPNDLFNTFFTTIRKEINESTSNETQTLKLVKRTSALKAYSEFEAKADKHLLCR